MQVGDVVEVQVLRADGALYRSWQATVERVTPTALVVFKTLGTPIGGPAGGWGSECAVRTCYWHERHYNLAEVYEADGRLLELYANIASPPHLEDGRLSYVDYELDVVCEPGGSPRVVDEDEFAEAVLRYGYSAKLQAACRWAVEAAKGAALAWRPGRLDP